jgi:hypothetical protein
MPLPHRPGGAQRNKTMLPLPPVIALTLAAVGAVALAKVLAREWRRVNTELHPQESDWQHAPTLRRDPSGVYRPEDQ